MRANEYFLILQWRFGDKLKIEAIEGLTEWGTRSYEIAVYITDLVMLELKEKGRKIDFITDGVASCLDLDSIGKGDTFGEAVYMLFDYCHNKDLLHEED